MIKTQVDFQFGWSVLFQAPVHQYYLGVVNGRKPHIRFVWYGMYAFGLYGNGIKLMIGAIVWTLNLAELSQNTHFNQLSNCAWFHILSTAKQLNEQTSIYNIYIFTLIVCIRLTMIGGKSSNFTQYPIVIRKTCRS